MQRVKCIHFVGIKGVGMTPLAIIAKEAGIKVSGCDIEDEFITDELLKKAGISPLVGFSKTHLLDLDLVITTGAHGGFNNPEVLEARRKGIKVMTQGEAIGVFMKGEILGRDFTGISVTGTHGKTTTAAMITTVFKESGLEPSFVIGTGFIPSLSSSGHYGKGRYFIAEADEYMTEPSFDKTIKFMWQHPGISVFTNIEFDHPDVYKSIDETRGAFLEFANQLPKDGLLVVCGDDWEIKRLLREYKGRYLTYGFSKDNDFIVKNVKSLDGKAEFEIERNRVNLGKVRLAVFGKQNVLNATAAFIVGTEEGLSIEAVKRTLLSFSGTKRRSEYIGRLDSGAMLFDDYAHHPTEIKTTLKAFRENFPNSKIVCVFQPHMYSRTKSLFEQFITSFMDANTVIITDTYASLREKPDLTVSSKLLAERLGSLHGDVIFLPKLSDVVEYVNKKAYQNDTILITMGAGDVYKINSKLKMQK